MPEEDLSDKEIDLLLRRAAERSRAQLAHNVPADHLHSDQFPALGKALLRSKHAQQVATFRSSNLVSKRDRELAEQFKKIDDPAELKKPHAKEKLRTAGPEWFDLPQTRATPEVKRDIKIIKMRGVLDPKTHYKRDGDKMDMPQYSQVGTIIEGPTEYYNARLRNKDRRETLLEEVLAGEAESGRFKKEYKKIQASKTSRRRSRHKVRGAKGSRNPPKGY